MRLDGMRHRVAEDFVVALRAENIFRAIRRRGLMSGASFIQADVVQQSGGVNDFGIGPFGLRNPISQVDHPQDVIEVVRRIMIRRIVIRRIGVSRIK
jgi:hypothetical protein